MAHKSQEYLAKVYEGLLDTWKRLERDPVETSIAELRTKLKFTIQQQKLVIQQLKQESQQQVQLDQEIDHVIQELKQKKQCIQEVEQGYQELKCQFLERGLWRVSIKALTYKLAVTTGKHAANQFKLVMLGPEGGGKTSTVQSLLGKDFQPSQPTVGADVSNSCTVDCHCAADWNGKELSQHLQDISIHYKHELQEAMLESTIDHLEIKWEDSKHIYVMPSEDSDNIMSVEDSDVTVAEDIMQNKMIPEDKIRIVANV